MNKPVKTFSNRRASQKHFELYSMIDRINKVGTKSYLEIGARHGDTFHEVMIHLPRGSLGVAVDLPGGAWGVGSSRYDLDKACDDLQKRGYTIHRIFGDSTDTQNINFIKSISEKFDSVLIDGDHRYEGVKKDFENYLPLAKKLIAFHDIDGDGVIQKTQNIPVEVPRLWNEIKHNYKYEEFISTEEPNRPMGIGVLYLQQVLSNEITFEMIPR